MKCYSTDIVRLVCDLAYMPRSQARKLEFNEEFIFKQMLKLRNEQNDKGQDDRGENMSASILESHRQKQEDNHDPVVDSVDLDADAEISASMEGKPQNFGEEFSR